MLCTVTVLDPQVLDYETMNSYTFTVRVRENLRFPAENVNSALTTAQVNIRLESHSLQISILLFIHFLLKQERMENIAYMNLKTEGLINSAILEVLFAIHGNVSLKCNSRNWMLLVHLKEQLTQTSKTYISFPTFTVLYPSRLFWSRIWRYCL